MRRQRGILEKIERANMDDWLSSIGETTTQSKFDAAVDEFVNPGRKLVVQMVDEELAELAAHKPKTMLGQLAVSEMRRREAWRGPARWSLIVAAIALVVSIVSIVVAANAG